jgi:hypothetical protein
MSTVTLELPDTLVEALKAHDVQDISQFAAGAMWEKIEYLDQENEQKEPNEGESETKFQSRIKAMRESLDAYERGEWVDGDEWIAQRRAEMAERKRHREASQVETLSTVT